MNRRPITANENEMGRNGGKTRAKRFSHAQIQAWDRLGGRPPKLCRRGIDQLDELVLRGKPKAVVAKKRGVSVRTFDRYLTR